MPHPVVHWEIAGKDGAKLQQFYGTLFDWNVQQAPQMDYGMVDPGSEGGIGGGIFTAPGEAPPYVTFYVHVEDLQAYLDRAESLGGKTILPPKPIPGHGSCAMFSDPEGNIIGLYKAQ